MYVRYQVRNRSSSAIPTDFEASASPSDWIPENDWYDRTGDSRAGKLRVNTIPDPRYWH
jgi:hypothetical protein